MDCALCRGTAGDPELMRVHVWEDQLWRLTASLRAEVPGFCYLEPKRHVSSIADLDGQEARTFGTVMRNVTAALRDEADAELVFVYIFGVGIPHLHVHLAPHRAGDALNTQMIRGEFEERPLPSGATEYLSSEFPLIPEAEQRELAGRVGNRLSSVSA
jgi:diadenosine tetraphosphate (Ap4A) HIT family hydrolase